MSDDHQHNTRGSQKGGEPRWGMSIQMQLLVAAAVLAVVPIVVVTFLLNRNTSSSLENEAEAAVANEAQALQTTLVEVINGHASDAILVGSSESLYFRSADLRVRERFIDDHLAVWAYASDITVIAPNGDVLVGAESPGAYPNQFETQYFQGAAALSNGQAFVGDVGPDPITGEPVISIAAPYWAEGDLFLGVTRIAWPVAELNRFLAGLTGPEGRDINVYDANGVVIGSSSPDQVLMTGSVSSGGLERALQGNSGVVVEDFASSGADPVKSFVAFGPIAPSESVAILDWAVTVSTPEELVLEAVGDNALLSLITAVIVAIIALAIAFVLTRLFIRPIRSLADVAVEVAGGDLSARASATGPAEISATGVAFNQMLDEITGLIQTREQRDEIQREVSRLLTEVSDVARGDLTVQTDAAALQDENLGSIASSFNNMVAQLRTVVANVNETTNEVTTASSGILARSTKLVEVSSSNSIRIAETAAALDGMVLSMEQVTSNARLSSSVATEARNNAAAGSEAIRDTIRSLQAMRDQVQEAGRTVTRLGESSREIGQTVQFISQIARQTNTLALNASIQAARAGEHGRGFSVVAEEVRKLAERASAATRQIESMVTTIQADTNEAVTAMTAGTQQVADGVAMASRTGTRLDEIDAVINRLGEMIDEMSISVEEQATTAVDLAETMRTVSTSTAESTESTQDAAESATMLARLAERLRETVAVFRIGEDEGTVASPASMAADGD